MTAAGTRRSADRPQEHGRLRWADAARGACVLLVVTHHLVTKHVDLTLPERLDWAENFWLAVTSALKPLRMPLFFTLSGVFAARALARPWREVLGARVVGPYSLYAMWLCIHAVIFSFAVALPMNRTRNLTDLALDLVYASTGMWYLYALPVYFLLFKTLHRSKSLLLIVALGLSALALAVPLEAVNRVSVLQNFIYFAAGATFPQIVRTVADSERRDLSCGLAVAYAALGGVLLMVDAPPGLIILLVSGVAVPLAVRAAVRLSGWRGGGAAVTWVGRRTLPVYVLHVPVIALLHDVPNPLQWAGSETTDPALAAITALVYPVGATIVVTATCLMIHAVAIRCGFGWLFRRPMASSLVPAPGRNPGGQPASQG